VPIIGSTITPVVVFLPLTLLTGVTGVFFRSLALTMAVALLTSLVLALLFTPVLAERFVKAKPGENLNDEDEAPHGRVLGAIIWRYEAALGFVLDRRWIIGLTIILVLAGSYTLYHALGSEFLPEFDESAFILDYLAPPGASLAETDRMLQQVEELLLKTPEVESYSRRTGLEMGLFVTEPNTGDIAVKLKPDHKRSTQEVIAELREKFAEAVPHSTRSLSGSCRT
jgi:multidrug efflux pump subunit AcrB